MNDPVVATSVRPRVPEGAIAMQDLQRKFVEQIFNIAADAGQAAAFGG